MMHPLRYVCAVVGFHFEPGRAIRVQPMQENAARRHQQRFAAAVGVELRLLARLERDPAGRQVLGRREEPDQRALAVALVSPENRESPARCSPR
jgi:hypothetical protein